MEHNNNNNNKAEREISYFLLRFSWPMEKLGKISYIERKLNAHAAHSIDFQQIRDICCGRHIWRFVPKLAPFFPIDALVPFSLLQ